eukprot:TRINITY_DN28_c0_g1_i1.p1 TRINITY_DN28_c0_g1~~TRINITY_DN28_c0_g1_i1.p1  ORF type:complete len:339 (+),score=56.93 TRINITY_DN28_c0_g1_i1:49-1017(+)
MVESMKKDRNKAIKKVKIYEARCVQFEQQKLNANKLREKLEAKKRLDEDKKSLSGHKKSLRLNERQIAKELVNNLIKSNTEIRLEYTKEEIENFAQEVERDKKMSFGDKLKILSNLTNWEQINHILKDERCAICLCDFEVDSNDSGSCAIKLKGCVNHYFHKDCICECYSNKFLRCPVCLNLFGIRKGNQPYGTMHVSINKSLFCQGYTNEPTIVVQYNFPNGTQNIEHESPGSSYLGTARTGYFPATKEGFKVLYLLLIAWQRRLLFTIGTSLTTGANNVVRWNGIHHKTSTSGGEVSFGWPDNSYFNRVKLELAQFGVIN